METTTMLLLMLVAAATVSHVHSSQAPVKYVVSNLSSYKDCTESCNKCACTETWPPEVSLCVCLDNIPPAEKCKEKPLPYKECIQSCDSETACACTLVYPVELSSCVCLQPKQQQAEQCRQRSDDSSSIIRYKQCVQSCETCACTLIYPKELSECICLDYPIGAASQNSERVVVSSGNHDKLQGNGDEKGLIPYPECIQSCHDQSCACIRIWPPHLSLCVCLDETNNSNHSLNKQALSE